MSKRRSAQTAPSAGAGKRGPQGHIAYLLRQAQAAVRNAIDADLAAVGLTSPQFLVLNLLHAYPGISGAELARVAELTPQTVNLVVRRLEERGLVRRAQHATHGRVLTLELSAQGVAELTHCKRLADRTEERILALLDAAAESSVRQWLADVAVTLHRER